jgi:hypothetical protein
MGYGLTGIISWHGVMAIQIMMHMSREGILMNRNINHYWNGKGWKGRKGNPHDVYRIIVDSERGRNYEDESMPTTTTISTLKSKVIFETDLLFSFMLYIQA